MQFGKGLPGRKQLLRTCVCRMHFGHFFLRGAVILHSSDWEQESLWRFMCIECSTDCNTIFDLCTFNFPLSILLRLGSRLDSVCLVTTHYTNHDNFSVAEVYVRPFTQQVMGIDVTRYSLLYSLYSWPNVVLSIFGGFLLDRVFGIRLGTVIFSGLVCAGQLVFALGAFFGSFATMAAGRFIFG